MFSAMVELWAFDEKLEARKNLYRSAYKHWNSVSDYCMHLNSEKFSSKMVKLTNC